MKKESTDDGTGANMLKSKMPLNFEGCSHSVCSELDSMDLSSTVMVIVFCFLFCSPAPFYKCEY